MVSVADDAVKHVAARDTPCPIPDLECDEAHELHHFSDTSRMLFLPGGKIVVIRKDPKEKKKTFRNCQSEGSDWFVLSLG